MVSFGTHATPKLPSGANQETLSSSLLPRPCLSSGPSTPRLNAGSLPSFRTLSMSRRVARGAPNSLRFLSVARAITSFSSRL